jgi:class 3 adenylate cyclase/CHASE2 domain-containing sensor protein
VVRDEFAALRGDWLLRKLLPRDLDPSWRTLVRAELLGGDANDPFRRRTALDHAFDLQFDKALALQRLWHLFPNVPPPSGVTLAGTETEVVPVEPVARNAAAYGFADYVPEDDGVVRTVPLLVNHRGHTVPQFGLALAYAALRMRGGPEPELTEDSLILRPPGRAEPIVIPIHMGYRRGGGIEMGAELSIPWTGGRDWRYVFGVPDDAAVGEGGKGNGTAIRHLSLAKVVELIETRAMRRKPLERLNALRTMPRPKLAPLTDPSELSDERVRETLAAVERWVVAARERAASGFANMTDDQRVSTQSLIAHADFVRDSLLENDRGLARQEAELRETLRRAIAGKVVIVGWTATGAAADFVPTSLHARCPGAVAHGVIYNAIMTGYLWRRAPGWVEYVLTMMFGAIATLVMAAVMSADPSATRGAVAAKPARWHDRFRTWRTAGLTPAAATALGVSLLALWLVLNGWLLFGRMRIVMAVTPPLITVLLVWAIGIAAVASERFRITHLLRGYVDPRLVNYLTRNPEENLFETKQQEVTVCFSDLKGFTTLTQRLGGRMVALLQEYLTEMVIVIRRNDGVVNKFMGDGIMFIFGVPTSDGGNDPERAIKCVLEMQEALVKFVQRKRGDGYPDLNLTMRCGVHTGMAYVGDAGPKNAREYTALGDTTNLAARLETINKECGTLVLVSEATKTRVAESKYFFRPMGKVKVRNREGCVPVYELVGRTDEVSAAVVEQRTLLATIIGEFQTRQFDQCVGSIAEYGRRFGPVPEICDLYRARCAQFLETPPGNPFEGQVVEQS